MMTGALRLFLATLVALLVVGHVTSQTSHPRTGRTRFTLPPFTYNHEVLNLFTDAPEYEEVDDEVPSSPSARSSTTEAPSVDDRGGDDGGSQGSSQPDNRVGNIVSRVIAGPDRSQLPVNATPEQFYVYLGGLIERELEGIVRDVFPQVTDLGYRLKASARCQQAMATIGSGLRTKHPDSVAFLDATGKVPSGLVTGTISELGNYQQCLSINIPGQPPFGSDFVGMYCPLQINIPKPPQLTRFTYSDQVFNYKKTNLERSFIERIGNFSQFFYFYNYTVGACLPSACELSDVQMVIDHIMKPYNVEVTVGPHCTSAEQSWSHHWGPAQVSAALLIVCWAALIVSITLIDHVRSDSSESSGNGSRLMSALSLRHAWTRLVANKDDDERSRVSALNGIKCIMICWLIAANVVGMGLVPMAQLLKNYNSVLDSITTRYAYQPFVNGWLAAQALLFCSGFLLGWRNIERVRLTGANVTFGQHSLKRILKYSAVMGATVLLVMLLPVAGSGPLYQSIVDRLIAPCHENWPKNLIFANNFGQFGDTCMWHSTILSSVVQLSVFSFPLISILTTERKHGLVLCVIAMVVSVICMLMNVALNKIPAANMMSVAHVPLLEKMIGQLNFPVYHYMLAFFGGIFLASHMQVNSDAERKRRNDLAKPEVNIVGIPVARLVGWLLVFGLATVSLFSSAHFGSIWTRQPLALHLLVPVVQRLIALLAVSWTVMECVGGRGGLVNYFLSLRGFALLNRVSLSMYLVHIPLVWHFFASRRSVMDYYDIDMAVISGAIILYSAGLGCIGFLFVESPVSELVEMYLSAGDNDRGLFLQNIQQTVGPNMIIEKADVYAIEMETREGVINRALEVETEAEAETETHSTSDNNSQRGSKGCDQMEASTSSASESDPATSEANQISQISN